VTTTFFCVQKDIPTVLARRNKRMQVKNS